MPEKETIRPIYSELQGYLSQAPKTMDRTDRSVRMAYRRILEQLNNTIDRLNEVSGEDYSRFKVELEGEPNPLPYRTKLSGLISWLHGEYFSDEQPPFSGMPSTVITQTQQQNQTFQVELLLQMQSKIDEQLHKLEAGDERRGFLERVKGALKSVRNASELIALWLETGQEFGLTLEQLLELFK
jgi:hypothetical protein